MENDMLFTLVVYCGIFLLIVVGFIALCISSVKKAEKRAKEKKERANTKECLKCKSDNVRVEVVPINGHTSVTYVVCQDCGHKEELEREQTGINVVGLIIGIILVIVGFCMAAGVEIIPTVTVSIY